MRTAPTVRLGEVAAIDRVSVAPARIDGETLYVGLEDIESGGSLRHIKRVATSELSSSKFRFSIEHVLYGKLRPYLAKVARPGFSGVCSTDILPIRPGPRLDRDYLAHFLLQPCTIEWATKRSAGVNLPRLSPAALTELELPLPPLPEQRRIAAILDQADALRAKRRLSLTRLDALAQSIFIEMFGDPATNPKGWPRLPLAKLGENEDSKRIPVKSSDRESRPGPYPYYGASGIIDRVDDYIFEGTRLLIGEDGANLVARATPVAFIARGKFWVNNHAHVIASNGSTDLRYLEHFIEQVDLMPFVTGTAQPKLNRANLDKVLVPVPPLEQQQEFAKRICATEDVSARVRLALTRLNSLSSSLQNRAFSGDL